MKKIYIFLFCFIFVLSRLAAQSILIAESFEATSLPASWTFINTPASGIGWALTSNPFEGARSIRVYDYTNRPINAWAFTSAIPLNNTNPCSISLFVKRGYVDEQFKVTMGNASNVASQSTTLINTVVYNSNYTRLSVTFTPQTSGNYYFGFNFYFRRFNIWRRSLHGQYYYPSKPNILLNKSNGWNYSC